MKVRPRKFVENLLQRSYGPYGHSLKIASFAGLMAHAILDQDRRDSRSKTQRDSAKRVKKSPDANTAQRIVLANIFDHFQRRGLLTQFRLLRLIKRYGGLTEIGNGPQSGELIARVKKHQLDIEHVNLIVRYLVQSKVYPEYNLRPTIEDAKAFVWLSRGQYGVSKIGQVWEKYKLVAPYLYALSLEKTSNDIAKVQRQTDLINWIARFVSNPRRVVRFLGHASFVMDRLSEFARDQRGADLKGVYRWEPTTPRLSPDELVIYSSIDRQAEDYGRSFNNEDHVKRGRPSLGKIRGD
jgi:hypothetical protein